MSKDVNNRGKQSHKGRDNDRSRHWKHGKSSGKSKK